MTYDQLIANRPKQFRPPTGHGRCTACGYHTPTMGHPEGCPREDRR